MVVGCKETQLTCLDCCCEYTILGGGFKYFVFSPLLGKLSLLSWCSERVLLIIVANTKTHYKNHCNHKIQQKLNVTLPTDP